MLLRVPANEGVVFYPVYHYDTCGLLGFWYTCVVNRKSRPGFVVLDQILPFVAGFFESSANDIKPSNPTS